MKTDYTHIGMILDRSGSMSSCWSDVVGGYKQLVDDNKADSGKCTFTVAAFDTEYELIEDFSDIQNVNSALTVKPRGGTALLDAIGKTIVSIGEKLAKLDEDDRPMKVMILVQTDGKENASKEFKKDDIKKLIDEHTNVYNWQFQFLGSDLNSLEDAMSYGFRKSNISTVQLVENQEAWSTISRKTKMARSADNYETYAAAMRFTEQDQENLNKKWKNVL